MARRCFHDHLAEVCEIAREEASVIDFFYGARLGGHTYRKLLNQAVSAGLLEQTSENKYRVTDRGKKYLRLYGQLKKLVGTEK